MVILCVYKYRQKCQVASEASASSPEVCGHTLSGKFTTNLKQHLKKAHTSCYQEVVQEEEKARSNEKSRKCNAERKATGPQRSQMSRNDPC